MTLMPVINNFCRNMNHLNTFYLWGGQLKNKINKGLIIINISSEDTKYLKQIIKRPISLKNFVEKNAAALGLIDSGTVSFFKKLTDIDSDNRMRIERPFKYQPYVNLNSNCGSLNGKRVFPVGDSLFCGHPKMGNGLGSHLRFINSLVEKMNKY